MQLYFTKTTLIACAKLGQL